MKLIGAPDSSHNEIINYCFQINFSALPRWQELGIYTGASAHYICTWKITISFHHTTVALFIFLLQEASISSDRQHTEITIPKASAKKNAIGVFAIQTPQHFTYFKNCKLNCRRLTSSYWIYTTPNFFSVYCYFCDLCDGKCLPLGTGTVIVLLYGSTSTSYLISHNFGNKNIIYMCTCNTCTNHVQI